MRILTAQQMKAAEDAAAARGTSHEQLMENAGRVSAAEAVRLAAEKSLPKTALLLCGKGNNAGDAFVVARLLAGQGWHCQIALLLGEEGFSPLAGKNFYRLPPAVACAPPQQASFDAAVIIDGVFGTGFHGALPGAVRAAFARANKAAALRLALDIPSGMDCDTGDVAPGTFIANATFTFGAYKPGLLTQGNAGYTGEVLCLDIGL